MASKGAQIGKNTGKNTIVVKGNSGSTSTGPLTRSKAKATVASTKSLVAPNAPTPTSTQVNPRSIIIVTSLGAKQDGGSGSNKSFAASEGSVLGDVSPQSSQSISDADSSSGLHFGSLEENDSRSASPKCSESYSFSRSVVMPVMMAGAMSIEEQLASMAHAIEKLTKTVEEKDLQIANLMNRLEAQNIGESSQGNIHPPGFARATPASNWFQTSTSKQAIDQVANSASIGTLSVQQLQDMITNTIRAQFGVLSQSNLMYSKPYTKRIDLVRMPAGYQPPSFQQFDGKGNPKQHIAHFIETCNNAGTDGDLLVKQFVRTLEGSAFDWYTDLEPESIDSWGQMEREFLNRFYSTR